MMNGRTLLKMLVVPEPMRSPKACTLLVKDGPKLGSVDKEETVSLGGVTRRPTMTQATVDVIVDDMVGFLRRCPRTN
jgi:hypothetical protein